MKRSQQSIIVRSDIRPSYATIEHFVRIRQTFPLLAYTPRAPIFPNLYLHLPHEPLEASYLTSGVQFGGAGAAPIKACHYAALVMTIWRRDAPPPRPPISARLRGRYPSLPPPPLTITRALAHLHN